MIEVKVCVGTSCSYKGNLDIFEYLENDQLLEDKIRLSTCSCFNKVCKPDFSPVIMVGGELIKKATLGKVLSKIGEKINESSAE